MTDPAITVNAVKKAYRTGPSGPIFSLDDVSFNVPRGHIYGLLGPNGAGKTTLIKILTTLTRPTSGHATVCGFNVVAQPLQTRRNIAVVLQHTAVETLLTVEDNLRIYAYMHGIAAAETQRRLNLILDEFELREQAQETVQDLSLGSKRRVQVAKIFMVDSPVIFLDEGTVGMDPFMKRRVLDRIRAETKKGRTVLFTTQVLSEAEELCDAVMILHRGKTLASGSLHELRSLSKQMFRVSLSFVGNPAEALQQLRQLEPAEMRVEANGVELLFKKEGAGLLDELAKIARTTPLQNFEVRGAALEEIFMELVRAQNPATMSPKL
jgi:ABC-2 type transport system ATP-binding protein